MHFIYEIKQKCFVKMNQGIKTAATSVISAIARTIEPKDMFKHYKGKVYCVESVSEHTERDEILVNYHDITNPKKTWSRPLPMFNEYVTIDGSDKLRFENYVSNE